MTAMLGPGAIGGRVGGDLLCVGWCRRSCKYRVAQYDSTANNACAILTMVLQAAARRGMQDCGGQMRAYAAAERLSRALGDISQAYLECLRPTAEALGSKLGIAQDTCSLFPEEVQSYKHGRP